MRKAGEREDIVKKISEVRVQTSLARYVLSGDTRGTPSREALSDRAKRAKLPEKRDLTGILLGDPPAGRSALDAYKNKPKEAEPKSIWDGVDFDAFKK